LLRKLWGVSVDKLSSNLVQLVIAYTNSLSFVYKAISFFNSC
jgi:hypothetical protein